MPVASMQLLLSEAGKLCHSVPRVSRALLHFARNSQYCGFPKEAVRAGASRPGIECRHAIYRRNVRTPPSTPAAKYIDIVSSFADHGDGSSPRCPRATIN